MLCVILLQTALLFVAFCCWYLCLCDYHMKSTTSRNAEMNVTILNNEQIEIIVSITIYVITDHKES